MRFKWAWILGIFGIAVSTLLVAQEHIVMARGSVADWLVAAFKSFDYPGYLAAPWIVDRLPFITHGDISPNMTEVYLFEGFYVLMSGLEWFAIGAIITFLSRRLRSH